MGDCGLPVILFKGAACGNARKTCLEQSTAYQSAELIELETIRGNAVQYKNSFRVDAGDTPGGVEQSERIEFRGKAGSDVKRMSAVSALQDVEGLFLNEKMCLW